MSESCNIELRERSPECQKAYCDGYNAACKLLKQQMLGKMGHYRKLLRDAVIRMDGPCGMLDRTSVINRINQELKLNPEFEVLDHMPHGVPMCCEPDAYKEIKQ